MLSNVQVNVWKHTSRLVKNIKHSYGSMTMFHTVCSTCAEHKKILLVYDIYQATLQNSHENITLIQSYSFYNLHNLLRWCMVRNHCKLKLNIVGIKVNKYR